MWWMCGSHYPGCVCVLWGYGPRMPPGCRTAGLAGAGRMFSGVRVARLVGEETGGILSGTPPSYLQRSVRSPLNTPQPPSCNTLSRKLNELPATTPVRPQGYCDKPNSHLVAKAPVRVALTTHCRQLPNTLALLGIGQALRAADSVLGRREDVRKNESRSAGKALRLRDTSLFSCRSTTGS